MIPAANRMPISRQVSSITRRDACPELRLLCRKVNTLFTLQPFGSRDGAGHRQPFGQRNFIFFDRRESAHIDLSVTPPTRSIATATAHRLNPITSYSTASFNSVILYRPPSPLISSHRLTVWCPVGSLKPSSIQALDTRPKNRLRPRCSLV